MGKFEQIEQQESLPQQASSKKKYLWIGIVLTVIVGGGIFVWYIVNTSENSESKSLTSKETLSQEKSNLSVIKIDYNLVTDALIVADKLAYIARENKYRLTFAVIYDGKEVGSGYDYVYKLDEVNGKLVFVARKDDTFVVNFGGENIGTYVDLFPVDSTVRLQYLTDQRLVPRAIDNLSINISIGDHLIFLAYEIEDPSKKAVYIDGLRQDLGYGEVVRILDVAGKPAYVIQRNSEYFIIHEDKEFGPIPSAKHVVVLGDKIGYTTERGGQTVIMINEEIASDGYTITVDSTFYGSLDRPFSVGGKLAFLATRNDRTIIVMDGKEIGEQYDNIFPLGRLTSSHNYTFRKTLPEGLTVKDRPAFVAQQDGFLFIVVDGKESMRLESVTSIDLAGDTFVFLAQIGEDLSIIKGNEIFGSGYKVSEFATVSEDKIILQTSKDDQSIILFDDEVIRHDYDSISDEIVVTGKLAFAANTKDGESIIYYDGRELGQEYDSVSYPISLMNQLIFTGKKGNDVYLVVADGALLLPPIVEESTNQGETGEQEEGDQDEESQPAIDILKQAKSEATVDASAWQLYTNPQFGYSLKIPPDFEDVGGDNIQKRFHVHIYKAAQENPGLHSGDFCNDFHCPDAWVAAELQILVLSHDSPAVGQSVQEAKDSFKRFQELVPGEKIDEVGLLVQKIQNVDLDGCLAPQLNLMNYQPSNVTSCTGDKSFISFILQTDRVEDLEKYKPLYDVALSTFRFNEFSLDK